MKNCMVRFVCALFVLLCGLNAAVSPSFAARPTRSSSEAEAVQHPLASLTLEGVVVSDQDGESRAIIMNSETRTVHFYSPGDVIKGLKVVEITDRGVVFSGPEAGETFVLRMAGSGVSSSAPEGEISLDFNNIDIRTVIKFFSDLTASNFIVDDEVRGAITVMCPRKIPISEAMALLESILEVKGYAMVPAGDVIKVMSKREASQRSIPLVIPAGGESPPTGDVVVTRMIKLQHADAGSIRRTLGQLFSKDTSVIVDPAANILIITDNASRIERLAAIIEQLDRPGETVPIRRLIKKYSDLSGQNVVVGPGVQGNVMFNIPDEIPKDEYLAALKAVIEVSGCKMEQSGSFIKIERVAEPKEEEQKNPGERIKSGPKRPESSS